MISSLVGKGWVMVDPPGRYDPASAVARYNGEPIKAGFEIDTIEDSPDMMHKKYRSGQYDLEVKIDFEIGRGRVRVEEAEGYD